MKGIELEKTWYSLKEACEIKGISYRTALNRKILCPNGNVPDGIVTGRKMFRRETIEKWINKTDEELLQEGGQDE